MTKLMAILRAVRSFAEFGRPDRWFVVYKDSQGAIESLWSLIFPHPFVRAMHDGLAQVVRVNAEVTFCRLPGQFGAAGSVWATHCSCPAFLRLCGRAPECGKNLL